MRLFEARDALRKALRHVFETWGYLEVDTPVLVIQPGMEAHMDYFSTTYSGYTSRKRTLGLRSSPELHMKKLLAQGYERIYQIGPAFRNGGEFTPWHHPEFTMLEWYQVGIGFEECIEQTHELLTQTQDIFSRSHAQAHKPVAKLHKVSVAEAFIEAAGLELIDQDPELAAKASGMGLISIQEQDDFETAFYKIMLDKVEPWLEKLGYVCLYDYPASQAILSEVQDGVAKRFEFYIQGVELCNAFQECLSAAENRRRFEDINAKRKELRKLPLESDPHFYRCLEQSLPACCGNALGFDRWLALLLGGRVSEVIGFRREIWSENF